MPDTIIDYLKESCDVTFSQEPLNDVDSLVLCQLAYLKFDGIVPGINENRPSMSMEQIYAHQDYEKIYADVRYAKENRALFEGILNSKRFRNLRMNCYVNIIEKEWQTQFSAITFFLEDELPYIAFRGTDETIVGWKEDFNMSFISPVPSQSYSVKYLNIVTQYFKNGFYVGGHSKGGNLAIYSSMNCIPMIRDRIIKIYSMDGPGFRREILEKLGYANIADRIVKIIPHSSMIGMLFEWDNNFTVVESKAVGFSQHNPYNWCVEGNKFIVVPSVYTNARRMDNVFNDWLMSLSEEELRTFGDTLYYVITASEVDDLIQFSLDWRNKTKRIISSIGDVDPETAMMLKRVVGVLLDIIKLRIKHRIDRGLARGGKLKGIAQKATHKMLDVDNRNSSDK